MAIVEITHVGFETLMILEQYMSEFISNPEQLSEQLLDIVDNKLSQYPQAGPVCCELEGLGVTDYFQLTVENNYKILYRYDESSDKVYVTAFMRTRQSAEKLLLQYALLK